MMTKPVRLSRLESIALPSGGTNARLDQPRANAVPLTTSIRSGPVHGEGTKRVGGAAAASWDMSEQWEPRPFPSAVERDPVDPGVT